MVSGTELAPKINEYVNVNGIPLVKLENLLRLKQYASKNSLGKNKNKTNGNIVTLKKIINARGNRTNNIKSRSRKSPMFSPTRSNFNSPPPKSGKRSRLNFRTPPHSPPSTFSLNSYKTP